MRASIALCVSLMSIQLVPSPVARAQTGASAPGKAAVQTVVLDNGLTLLLSPSTAHPVIGLSMFVLTGGRTEDEYFQGSLHYIEHLVYKGGTPNLPPTQFRKTMSLIGREAGGWTWDDEINFGFEVAKESFAEALGVFHEALLELQFEEQWFEAEKKVVLQEMERGLEQPGRSIYNAWDELAFTAHPYGRTVIGTEKAITELEMRRTERYYRERFSPNHILLSIAGDFEPDEMVQLITEAWGAQEPGPASFELGVAERKQRGARWREDFLPQATDARLLTGVVGPGGSHEDTPALLMLAELLEDRSYGLPQFLVEQEKWVTNVSASHYFMRDYSTFRVSARLQPEHAHAVREFVHPFLLGFDARTVPHEIFEATQQRLLISEARRRATFASRAERVGFLVSRMGEAGARGLLDQIAALTPEEVQAAKERWIAQRKLVTVTVFPESFDPSTAEVRHVEPRTPTAPPVPNLHVAGALEPPAKPALSYERSARTGDVALYTYENGLRLIVRQSDASPLLAVSGRVLGGQWVEPTDQAGINRFVAELGLRSTRRWDRESFLRLLGSLAMNASVHISVGSRANTSRNVDYRDSGAQHYSALANKWREVLAALKETVFFPDFDRDEIEKLRTDVLNEIRALTENNLEYIKQEFYVRAFRGHPYGRPTVGTEASVSAFTVEDLRRFHATHWAPDRTVVSMVGDIDPDEVARWVASRWADLPARRAGPLDRPEVPAWSPDEGRQVLPLGKDQWTVNWGRPGVPFDHPDYTASVILSSMAGNHHFYKYVYGEGVSYRSWIRFWATLGPGAWIVENDIQRERYDDMLDLFDEDLQRYSTDGFTEDEFRDAAQRITNAYILGAQNNARMAWRLAVAEGNGLGFQHYLNTLERVSAVQYEQVQTLARAVFRPDRFLRLLQK